MNLVINYLLVGILVQFFMVWASNKMEQEELIYTHTERILLVLFWPLAAFMIIYNLIIVLITKE